MLTDEIEIPDWPAATSEDEVLDQVRRRARVIKAQRRIPVGFAALAILTAVAVTASTGAGQPSGLRTADHEGSGYIVDEDRDAEAGPVSGNAQAQARTQPPGGRAGARAKADTPWGPASVDGGDWGANEPATVPLTVHPLYRDPSGDPTSLRDPMDFTDMPSVDLTVGDIQLEDDEVLSFRATVADLSSFRGDDADTLYVAFNATAHSDVRLQAAVYLNRNLEVTSSFASLYHDGGAGVDVPLNIAVDEATSSVIVRVSLDDINKATESTIFATRSAQGDITFKVGTHLTDLRTSATYSPADLTALANSVSDQANAPYDSYWAIGD